MVKVSFNSALAQKDVKKDAETLIPEDTDPEGALIVRHHSRTWCWCMCLGLALILFGMVFTGAYVYQHLAHEKNDHQVYFCGAQYMEENYMIREEEEDVEVDLANGHHLRFLKETIQVLERDQVELIEVPVPDFDDGDPAQIVHDFQRSLTAYLDLNLNKCYVIPLNTSVVMPPRDLLEVLINIKAGSYLPQTYLVREEMMVTERLEHVEQLGFFIANLCLGKETYKLQHRDRILGMQKREVLNCHKIRHFENKFVMETLICEP
ncbi:integral membrane protein 2B-like isoform X2 [Melanotaenia boesemani]|uniref:integral membrane protein 2B-like isoform X2 n=1 Tax=Melanotaenia boesemani TaxID=1250792 RepID=UPI001C051686|nr:integral membrane protein 2B-like isoform X2 [Melanotaenia boesemani]